MLTRSVLRYDSTLERIHGDPKPRTAMRELYTDVANTLRERGKVWLPHGFAMVRRADSEGEILTAEPYVQALAKRRLLKSVPEHEKAFEIHDIRNHALGDIKIATRRPLADLACRAAAIALHEGQATASRYPLQVVTHGHDSLSAGLHSVTTRDLLGQPDALGRAYALAGLYALWCVNEHRTEEASAVYRLEATPDGPRTHVNYEEAPVVVGGAAQRYPQLQRLIGVAGLAA